MRQLLRVTQAEQAEHSVAAERRRMRLIHHDIMKDILNNESFQKSITEGMCGSALSFSEHFSSPKGCLCVYTYCMFVCLSHRFLYKTTQLRDRKPGPSGGSTHREDSSGEC